MVSRTVFENAAFSWPTWGQQTLLRLLQTYVSKKKEHAHAPPLDPVRG